MPQKPEDPDQREGVEQDADGPEDQEDQPEGLGIDVHLDRRVFGERRINEAVQGMTPPNVWLLRRRW